MRGCETQKLLPLLLLPRLCVEEMAAEQGEAESAVVASVPLLLHGREVKRLLLGNKRGILERGSASSSWLSYGSLPARKGACR